MMLSNTLSHIRRDRMNLILQTILGNKKITRGRLAELIGLSQSSIVKYVKFLQDMGLIKETTKTSTKAGRKSVYIAINNDIGVNITVIFYVTHIRGVLVDLGGNILEEFIEPSYKNIPKDLELQKLYKVVDVLLEKSKALNKKSFGIGLAMGGYLNPSTGVSYDFLYATDWYDVPLKEMVSNKYNIPCFLMNDANAFAMGDKYYGFGLGYDHFMTIKMDEGIGIGIIANGSLYLGANNYSGELGHTIVHGNKNICYCGHTGCLETICSKTAILETCQKGLASGVYTEISRLRGDPSNQLTIEQVMTAANNGDRFARNLFEAVGEALGDKLSDIVNVFNPQLLIFRGQIIDGNKFLFDTVQRIVSNQILRHTADPLKIRYAEKNENIDVKGVNAMILMNYFSSEVK